MVSGENIRRTDVVLMVVLSILRMWGDMSTRAIRKKQKDARPPAQGASKYAPTCDTILLNLAEEPGAVGHT